MHITDIPRLSDKLECLMTHPVKSRWEMGMGIQHSTYHLLDGLHQCQGSREILARVNDTQIRGRLFNGLSGILPYL